MVTETSVGCNLVLQGISTGAVAIGDSRTITPSLLSDEEVRRVALSSLSPTNFAVKLLKVLYNEAERTKKNCAGLRGKDPLSPNRLEFIKAQTLLRFPPAVGSSEALVWKSCTKMIDTYLRKNDGT